MTSNSPNTSAIDASAITLSGLCIVHCLAIPVLAAVLPINTLWFEQEWIHQLFVLTAVPVTGYAVFTSMAGREGLGFPIAAMVGLSLLIAGAFVERLHDFETALTVTGAVILAAAHMQRWFRRHKHGNPE